MRTSRTRSRPGIATVGVAGVAGLEDSAGGLDRLERDPPAGVDVRANRVLRRLEVAGLEAVDDRAVLDDEV